MTKKNNTNELILSTEAALERVLSRIVALQDGYIVILLSKNIALKGNKEMEKAISELENDLKSSKMEAHNYFLSILFLDLLSEVEIFLSSIVQAVIKKHPKKIRTSSFKLGEIIDSKSIDELITRAADEYINKLMYKKPMEYLDSICEVLSIEKQLFLEHWPMYVEAKARRDLGVHNGWTCNSTYLRKVEEVKITSDIKEGDSALPIYEGYVRELLKHLRSIVTIFSEQIKIKYV